MSHAIDDTYDVYLETPRKARKAHTCCACRETIAAGHRYTDVRIVWQGEVEQLRRCARCQALHMHLRRVGQAVGDVWPAERLDCGETYEREWCEEPPPGIAALAFWRPGDPVEVSE